MARIPLVTREAIEATEQDAYDAFKTRLDGAQYKPAGFAAVYIGFRCAYEFGDG